MSCGELEWLGDKEGEEGGREREVGKATRRIVEWQRRSRAVERKADVSSDVDPTSTDDKLVRLEKSTEGIKGREGWERAREKKEAMPGRTQRAFYRQPSLLAISRRSAALAALRVVGRA